MNDAEIKKWHYQAHAETLIEKMEKKGFKVQYVSTAAEAKDLIMGLIPKGALVALGGSAIGYKTSSSTSMDAHPDLSGSA